MTGPDSTRRRRRNLRVRRRSAHSRGSILSAPTSRPVNLDDSVGSGALDVDSMLRFFASTPPAVDDRTRSSPTVKPAGLLPLPSSASGLPPSGRATSARRTYQRRRRRPNVTNDSSVDTTMSSSFDDAQMTSSNVDLKDATAAAAAKAVVISTTEPDMERSRPVRRSVRRRRRTISQSPSPAVEHDAEPPPPTTSISAEPTDPTDVIVPETPLWQLCGERLTDVCRRILNMSVTAGDTVHQVVTGATTSSADDVRAELDVNTEVDVLVQFSHADQQSSTPDDVPGSERRRGKNVSSDDPNAYRISLIQDVILPAAVEQTTSQDSSQPGDVMEEDNCNGVETLQATNVNENEIELDSEEDKLFEHKLTSQTPAVDYDSVKFQETAVNHVQPVSGEQDNEQLDTATYSSKHCSERVRPVEEVVSDRLSVVDVSPSNISENRVVEANDVISDRLNNDEETSSVVLKRTVVLPDLDISVMLSPSIELQDILDTIHTLTSGVVSGDNHTTEENDRTPAPPAAGAGSTTVCGRPRVEDRFQQHHLTDVEQLAAEVRLGCSFDDSLLDLDAESTYDDFDLSPAAADFAQSLHLALDEDDDDLDIDPDIEDAEYDLDDNEIL